MNRVWTVCVVAGAWLAGCNPFAGPPKPSPTPAPTAAPTAAPTPAPTATPTPKASPTPSPSPTATPTPGAADPSLDKGGFTKQPYTFTPAKGSTFSIVLPGHATEGYRWVLTGALDAKVLTGSGTSRAGVKPEGAGIGVSPPQVFDFTAAGSGEASIAFDLVQPSDAKKVSAENRTFGVKVP